jgi:hypothetical protein
LWHLHVLKNLEEGVGKGKKCPAEKNPIGRERPHFLGFQPPKKFLGSLPPWAPCSVPPIFSAGQEKFRKLNRRGGNTMSIIKKAPAILTREFRLEEPVSLLLDDYAQFIESSADHVINSAIKKTLWRDQDYRKWREQRRSADNGAARRGAEAATKS